MLEHKTTRTLFNGLLASLLLPALLLADEPKADPDPEVDVRVASKVITTGACPEIILNNGQKVEFLGASNRGFLGVELTNLSPELRDHFGVPGEGGVLVSRVVKGGAAEAAGITVGDIITRVDNEVTGSSGELGRVVRSRQGGELVTVEIFRDGGLQQLTTTLAAHERCALDISQFLNGIEVDLGDFDLGDLELEGLQALEALEGLEVLEGLEGLQALEGLEGLDLQALELDGLSELGVLGGEISAEVMRGLAEAFEGQEWQEAMERFESIDMEKLEENMERMEERMEELEERLEGERERIERDVERRQRERERQRDRERDEPSESPQDLEVPTAPQKL